MDSHRHHPPLAKSLLCSFQVYSWEDVSLFQINSANMIWAQTVWAMYKLLYKVPEEIKHHFATSFVFYLFVNNVLYALRIIRRFGPLTSSPYTDKWLIFVKHFILLAFLYIHYHQALIVCVSDLHPSGTVCTPLLWHITSSWFIYWSISPLVFELASWGQALT